MDRITQAIVLAAGEGQRLKPFTKLMPKVMLPVADKPILQYVVEALAQNGIRRIVMVVGYRKEQVQDYFGSGQDFGVEIEYVIQPQQLGVAHAVKQAHPPADARFLVVAGDNMIEPATIAPLIKADSNAMLVRTQEDVSRYRTILVEGGVVKGIVTDPAKKAGMPVDIGAYAFTRELFDFIGDEVHMIMVLQKMMAQGHQIAALETDGFWQDAVYPWDILTLNDMILRKIAPSLGGTIEDSARIKGQVSVGDGTVIRSGSYIVGPAIIGENCEIGPNVCIFPSTSLGNSVSVSPFSVLRNCSVANNVDIGPGSSIQDSIVAGGSIIGSHFAARSSESTMLVEGEYHQVTMGAIIGSYCEFGDNVITEPGTIVGNNCRIKALKVLSNNVPDGALVV